ncbi:hypothetical protein PYW07_009212 [Mythimna separata]|uniref:Protease inhibitor n=1 Tax=Mythimna separata TaxID=271217 RepID=A0AAD7YC41_MYTSE|nr:hypothetical protein PYW07_009212 [Mythimna separata]
MKFAIILCVFALVALSAGKPKFKRCIYVNGRCFKECEPGTYSYGTGCGPLTPEPTCDEPNPVAGRGNVCDFSACYCSPPTVREPNSRKCVKLEDCPKKAE